MIAQRRHQVVFFQPRGGQDVAGHRDREEQVPGRHGGRRPEGDDETEHERVAHQPVEKSGVKTYVAVWCSAPCQVHLPQAEQVGVADHEGGGQRDRPADPEQNPQHQAARGRATSQTTAGIVRHCQ